jgi:hypothetical protein
MTGYITIAAPHVTNGPRGVPEDAADADYLRGAARNLHYAQQHRHSPFGSTLTGVVAQMCLDAAHALETRLAIAATDPSPTNAFEDAEVAREEAKDEREVLARVIDPEAFEEHRMETLGKTLAIVQWSARRFMAQKAADAVLAAGYVRRTPETVLAIAESIGNHVAAEYDDDRALDDMILQLRALVAAAEGRTS